MRRSAALAALVGLLASGCTTNHRAEFHPPPGRDSAQDAALAETTAPFVKLHTHTGEVYVLDGWRFDEAEREVTGTGLYYSAERSVVDQGPLTVGYDQVALVETNTPETIMHVTSLVVMGVVVGVAVGGPVFCALNPKACFGSCPTFYVRDGDALELRAEGFSSAVAAALEERDVDHLGVVDPPAGRFELVMANEAYETHFLRHVELLSVARPAPEVEVFHARDGFVGVRDRLGPIRCQGLAGDCLAAVVEPGGAEYSSPSSAEDLAAREVIELEFPAAPPDGSSSRPGDRAEWALVVRARTTLLDTFLFYQGLAYLGDEAPRWTVRVDREGPEGPLAELLRGFDRALGDVEVEVWDGQRWRAGGQFREWGPIAHETQVVALPAVATGGPVRVRVSATQGRWKLDAVSLGTWVGPLPAVALAPVEVVHAGQRDPAALAQLLDPSQRLVSYPGEVWTLAYELPAGPQSLFLAAEGYYWEWPREAWLAEQSAFEAARFFADPRGTLRRLAPLYKAMEGELEPVFWQTRIQPLPLTEAGGVEVRR